MTGGNIECGQQLPYQDSLYLHAAIASYQATLWHDPSLVPSLQKPSSLDCKGWVISDEGDLMINNCMPGFMLLKE